MHIPDVLADPNFTLHEAQRAGRFRSMLGVPMLREGKLVGVIAVWTTDKARPFTEKQVELVSSFADQAVIAVENTRLLNETHEALEQQTATAEILKVISTSPTDLQPVMDALVETAANLCGATDAVIQRVEGDSLLVIAHYGSSVADMLGVQIPIERQSLAGRAVLDREMIHVADTRDLPAKEFAWAKDAAERYGYRAMLVVPMLRRGVAIGVIGVRREQPGAFSDKQVELLRTFGDQAVLAWENTRLFSELEARTEELTESLNQQTATSEVLRVISRSPGDLGPVLDALVKTASMLCRADTADILRVVGEDLVVAANYGTLGVPTGHGVPVCPAP